MADPAFVDTHVHFWDHSVPGLRWEWLRDGNASASSPSSVDAPQFLPPHLLAETEGTGLVGVVHGHCAHPIEDQFAESKWLDLVAEQHELLLAMVGGCRLGDPAAPALVRRHVTVARIRGVRDPGSMHDLDPVAAMPVLAVLAEHGLSLEVRRRPEQMGAIERIASEWPSIPIVLSHACLPSDRSPSSRASWTHALRQVARHPNVWCKISAVAGAADPNWTEDSLRPWMLTCIDLFGSSRCSLASNWPVDREFGTYRALVDAYRSITSVLDPVEQADVFHATAQRLYRLDLGGPAS